MTRSDILTKADAIVNGARNTEYGSPEDSFAMIARFWSDYLDLDVAITNKDVAAMMVLLKVARLASGLGTADCWIDIAGYAACGGELEANLRSLCGGEAETEKEHETV